MAEFTLTPLPSAAPAAPSVPIIEPVEAGNIDLTARPKVRTPDGDIATVRTMGIHDNGLEVNIPTVSDDGRLLSDDEAVELYRRTGKHLGKYRSVEEAGAAAEQLHLDQEKMYVTPSNRIQLPSGPPISTVEPRTGPREAEILEAELYERNMIASAFNSNLIASIPRSINRANKFPVDPDFDKESWFQQNYSRVAPSEWLGLREAMSATEGEDLIAQVESDRKDAQKLSSAGMDGTVAQFVTGIFDIDTVLIGAGGIAKMSKVLRAASAATETVAAAAPPAVKSATQAAHLVNNPIIRSGAMGTSIGGAFGTGHYLFDPQGKPSDIAGGMLFGLGMGTGIGALVHIPETVALRARANKIASEMPEAFMRSHSDPRYGIDRLEWTPVNEAVGRVVGDTHEAAVFSHAKVGDMSVAASKAVRTITNQFKDSPIATFFQKAIDKSFLESDAARLMNSKSDLFKWLGFSTLEHPSGAFRNNRSSAMLSNFYEERVLGPFMESYESNYKTWYSSKGISLIDSYQTKSREAFHREVRQELYAREVFGTAGKGQFRKKASPGVMEAADAIDMGSANADSAMKGLPGQTPLDGAHGFESYSGFFPVRWQGINTVSAIQKFGEDRVLNLIKAAYTKGLGDSATPEVVNTLAKALVRRARAKALDMDTAMFNYNTKDPQAFIRNLLVDHGVPEPQIDGLLKQLLPAVEERGRAGFTKRRTPIALDVSDGELHIMDLMDNNLPLVWSKYARSVAGQSALARKGITSKAKLDEIIAEGIKQDNAAGGKLTGDYVKGIFESFMGGPAHGGLSDGMRRIRMGTNLSLLSQLGIPQLAEYGVVTASIGLDRFLHYSPVAARMLKETKSGKMDLAQELQFFAGNSWNEHRLFRADLALDYARNTSQANSPFLRSVDAALAKGQRVQGYISGYYAIRPLQMKTAILGVTDKFFNFVRDGNWKELSRWEDFGFTREMINDFKTKYVDTGIVKWGEKGKYVDSLGMDEWKPIDIENFSTAVHRFTSQVIQKAEKGETSAYFHKDAWALLTHLNQFPLLAMQKQLLRNAKIADVESMTTALYGLMSASMAYTVKQAINGKTDNLDLEHIVKGGVALSNMTGFLPMAIDPFLYMVGAENYSISPYSVPGRAGTLPAMQVVSDLMKIPRPFFRGEFTPADAKAFHSLPLIGRMYGISALIDAFGKEDVAKPVPAGY